MPSQTPQASSRTSLVANLLLAGGSVALALVLVAALEGGLRLAGLGSPDPAGSRLRYQRIPSPIFAPAKLADGTAVLATRDPRLPFRTLRAEKSEASLRVFVFGGSATAGLGYSPNVTFARHLERMLTRAHPDREVEVTNLGIVALASKQVVALVEEICSRHAPDAIVVYSGNNEFLELHAEKFAASGASWRSRAGDALRGLHLFRLVGSALRGPPRSASLAELGLEREELRVTQHAMIQRIEVTDDEIAAVVERYGRNVDRIAAIAEATGTPLVLMTVASNWRYRGRDDLPADWLDEVLGEPGPADAGRARAAVPLLERDLDVDDPMQRWEARFRLAVAQEAAGEIDAARASYRRAMNEDPHLRRALDEMAERVRASADRRDAVLFDAVALLERESARGIPGFGEFYDYVHFTPRGALLVGTGLYRSLERAGITPPAPDFDAGAYHAERLAFLASGRGDPEERGEWMGIGFDASPSPDRDLWKYDRMLKELDRRIEADPEDALALVYRSNARAFTAAGGDGAERDLLAALALRPEDPVLRRNLAQLRAERPVP